MKKEVKGGISLKAMDDEGHGVARIAKLSAVDSDGDTYAAGAFSGESGEQWATILAAHNWQHIPLGKARVYEQGDEALAELHLNLDIQAGKDWHQVLKFDLEHASAHPVQEWSYGFYIRDAQQETRDGERVRVLKRLEVFEVSPVVKGAGVGTGTLSMKCAPGEQLDQAIAEISDMLARAAEDPKALGRTRLKQLGDIRGGIESVLEAAEADDREIGRMIAGQMFERMRHHLPRS